MRCTVPAGVEWAGVGGPEAVGVLVGKALHAAAASDHTRALAPTNEMTCMHDHFARHCLFVLCAKRCRAGEVLEVEWIRFTGGGVGWRGGGR